jgi:uncharacterized protein YjbJ (UPF0337 family)
VLNGISFLSPKGQKIKLKTMLIEEIIQLKKEVEKRIDKLKSEIEFYEMIKLPEYANYLAGKKDAYERIKKRLKQTLKKVAK